MAGKHEVQSAWCMPKGMYSLELLRGTSMHGTFVPAGKQQGKLHHILCNLPCCLPAKTNIPCMELTRKSFNEALID